MAYSARPMIERCSSMTYPATTRTNSGSCAGNDAAEIALPERQEASWEVGVVRSRVRDAFRNATKEREGSQRDDERRNLEAGDEQGVERAARRTDDHRRDRGERNGKTEILVRGPEHHSREAQHGADRQVDAACDDHRRERHGQQPELHAEPGDFEEVADGEKVRRNDGKERDLREDSEDQPPFAIRKQARQCRHFLLRRRHQARAPAPARRV